MYVYIYIIYIYIVMYSYVQYFVLWTPESCQIDVILCWK